MRKFIVIIMTLVSVSLYGQEQVHVGDILCTDNTVISHDAFASSGRTALGIVFFVDNTQQHGWALALNDASATTMPWGDNTVMCYLDSYSNYTQLTMNDTIGSIRCDSIARKAQHDGMTLSAYSIAVNTAIQYGEGWYLPAIGQLAIMYANMPEINAALDVVQGSSKMNGQRYWSCTEENTGVTSAWLLLFNGASTYSPKGDYASVRAIRNF
ncbi:MAG: hypothetical protein J5709_11240 [Bacteroidales bacterium]|nr:hypothetical protein [Bacteroidales bacterium]